MEALKEAGTAFLPDAFFSLALAGHYAEAALSQSNTRRETGDLIRSTLREETPYYVVLKGQCNICRLPLSFGSLSVWYI